ncbi:MAG TPA: histidinol-phosphatase HisJ family protein [Kiritimatiellia bacterium]|nr:histidinol-phosphatase HisJ family protein [Kiritimatiellia bacterium]HQQ05242.1 histidinol-phosphatase HisJ family protein [Kiritimatiellia bacterium]
MIKLPPDYHTHTELCRHAEGRPGDYFRAAAARGLPAVACTDHSPAPDGFDPEHRMTTDEFEVYEQWFREEQDRHALPCLFGIEADWYPGCELYMTEWLAAQDFDLVIGSVHYLDYWAFFHSSIGQLWEREDVGQVWRQYFELIRGLAASGMYDIIGHIDLPKKFGHRPPDGEFREIVLPVLDAIAGAGTAIEINTSGFFHPVAEAYPSAQILHWARERDIPITFGSDSHKPKRVGNRFEDALALAKEAGYAHSLQFSKRRKTLCPLP